jgi:hypothetical protein
VRIEDTDPKGAAEMANFYVDQLDRLVARFNTGEAGRQRSFVTEQLARAKGDLGAAEEALRSFQERNAPWCCRSRRRARSTSRAAQGRNHGLGGPAAGPEDISRPMRIPTSS